MKCALQMKSEETFPILQEAQVAITLGQYPLTTFVFVANITIVFILGLDFMHAHDVSMDYGDHMLKLGDEQVSVSLYHMYYIK
jgi:hypothetical protein